MTSPKHRKKGGIKPLSEIESAILSHPDIIQGLSWGRPSYGHPEPTIEMHVRDVLKNVDALQINREDWQRLRLAAMTHDSFKFKEYKFAKSHHHGKLARIFLEQFTDDLLLLELLEWHDEAYHAWQLAFCHNNVVLANRKIRHLFQIFGSDIQLYRHFFICDSSTGDKRKQPMAWFSRILQESSFGTELSQNLGW